MKKFLLPSKREGIAGAEASNSEPPGGGVDNRRNKRAADTYISPVVIKIESDVSSDSAFEGSPARLIGRKPKQVTKQQKFRAKTDESSVNVLCDTPSATSFPAFPSDIEDAQSSLLTWCALPLICCCQMSRKRCRYAANKRDLPWRRQIGQNAAYGVWVSEIMLQQTRVATVIEYWNRWMTKWPSLTELAASNIDDVNAMWSGLGYYRRARMLLEVI